MEEEHAGDTDVSMKTPIVSNEDPNQTCKIWVSISPRDGIDQSSREQGWFGPIAVKYWYSIDSAAVWTSSISVQDTHEK